MSFDDILLLLTFIIQCHELHEIISFSSPDELDEPDAGAMYCLVKSGASGDYFSNPLRALRGVRWQNNYLLLNKLLSPESKTYELL